MQYNFIEAPIYKQETETSIAPSSSENIIITGVKSDAKALKIVVNYALNPSLYLSNYSPKIQVRAEIEYKNTELKNDLVFSVINRNTTENILELKGNDINQITLTIFNNSSSTLTFSKFEVLQSQDISPTQIATVLKEETIQADLIHATSVFTDALFTQILQTNAMSRSARLAKSGDIIDYFMAEGSDLGCYSATLGTEQEQFKIITTTAGTQTEHLYWYAIIEGEDAYKYLTTIDPREKYPDISDSDRDKFKFMVLKPTVIGKKFAITFAPDENGNLIPTLIFGVGTSTEEGSNNGKGFIYKNTNGFYHIYCQSNGNNVGIVMDETGVHITGWADQHCESILFKDNGVKIKFVGEETHNFEYIFNDSAVMTGILQDQTYLTTVWYEAGTL